MGTIQLEIFHVRPEHVSLVAGCTRACRHIAEKLNAGTPLTHKDFGLSGATGERVALCNQCTEYAMSHQPKQ